MCVHLKSQRHKSRANRRFKLDVKRRLALIIIEWQLRGINASGVSDVHKQTDFDDVDAVEARKSFRRHESGDLLLSK